MRPVDLRLPDAFIAGAQKAGTTALHRLIEAHPEVFVPAKPQEIHFFDLEENFRQGPAWLAAFFAARRGEPVALQTSPLYLFEPTVASRIAELVPRARLIFVLRDPVDRAYSHYWHEVRYGWEDLPFEEALEREPERLSRGFAARRHFSYAARGRYATQLRRFLDHFPRAQLLAVRSEDLRADPAAVARRCAELLGVDAGGWAGEERALSREVNRAEVPRLPALQRLTRPLRPSFPRLAYLVDLLNLRRVAYPPMAPATRRRLREELRPEVEETARLTGLDLGGWLAPAGEGPR